MYTFRIFTLLLLLGAVYGFVIKRSDTPTDTSDPFGLGAVEAQVDVIVYLAKNFEKNSSFKHPVLVAIAEQKLEYLLDSSVTRCLTFSGTYSSVQSQQLLVRVKRIVSKLEISLAVFIDLKQEFGVYLGIKLLIERIYKLIEITDNATACFSGHVHADSSSTLKDLQVAIHTIFDHALEKLK
ncbi:hypothetical protein INT44_000075 [Umbelopsis vinacea]|uniref:Uncharacterized protein n=1 Tax=Umbelopsis vinacea TaxID=44442 RepID=A0A8H7UA24_9FUNG|nr:hypothetical protein INT44_000075 [Umbelopsis vinacea]